MAILPKAIYRLNAIPIKISVSFFRENEKNNLKIHLEAQITSDREIILNKNRNADCMTTP